LVVALVSAALAAVVARIPSSVAAWLLALVIPALAAHALYWLPFWMGADDLEAGAWAGLFIILWYIPGAIASLGVVALLRRR